MSNSHTIREFEISQTKIKGGCQSGRKVVPHDSKSDFPSSIQEGLVLGVVLIHFLMTFVDKVFLKVILGPYKTQKMMLLKSKSWKRIFNVLM